MVKMIPNPELQNSQPSNSFAMAVVFTINVDLPLKRNLDFLLEIGWDLLLEALEPLKNDTSSLAYYPTVNDKKEVQIYRTDLGDLFCRYIDALGHPQEEPLDRNPELASVYAALGTEIVTITIGVTAADTISVELLSFLRRLLNRNYVMELPGLHQRLIILKYFLKPRQVIWYHRPSDQYGIVVRFKKAVSFFHVTEDGTIVEIEDPNPRELEETGLPSLYNEEDEDEEAERLREEEEEEAKELEAEAKELEEAEEELNSDGEAEVDSDEELDEDDEENGAD
jgi:hypothetical protein